MKDCEVRKQEILLTARVLFFEKGYAQTSVADVLKAVGIAKGTFYYYFASKENLLDSVIDQIVDEGLSRAAAVLKDKTVSVPQRIQRAFQAAKPDFDGATKIHQIKNLEEEHLYLRKMLQKLPSILIGTVTEGIEAGVFHTPYPKECIETVFLIGHMLSDNDTFGKEPGEYQRRIQAFLFHIERLVGVKEGSMSALDSSFLYDKEREKPEQKEPMV